MLLRLADFMEGSDEGWGRAYGRQVYNRLLDFIEMHPGILVFKVSLEGIRRVDISFASETIVELARRYRGQRGFCFVDLNDPDMLENWDAAAQRKEQPLLVWRDDQVDVLGKKPSPGLVDAFNFSLEHPVTKAAEYVSQRRDKNVSSANASMKFKQLWHQGLVLRRDERAASGGVEYSYQRIG